MKSPQIFLLLLGFMLLGGSAYGAEDTSTEYVNRFGISLATSPAAASGAMGEYDYYNWNADILPDGPMAGIGGQLSYERQVTRRFILGIGLAYLTTFNHYDNDRHVGGHLLSLPLTAKWLWPLAGGRLGIYTELTLAPGVLLFANEQQSYLDDQMYRAGFSMKLLESIVGLNVQLSTRIGVYVEGGATYVYFRPPDSESFHPDNIIRSEGFLALANVGLSIGF